MKASSHAQRAPAVAWAKFKGSRGTLVLLLHGPYLNGLPYFCPRRQVGKLKKRIDEIMDRSFAAFSK